MSLINDITLMLLQQDHQHHHAFISISFRDIKSISITLKYIKAKNWLKIECLSQKSNSLRL